MIWWEGSLSGSESIGIPWIVLPALTRLMTHPQLRENAHSTNQVGDVTNVWLSCSHVSTLKPSENATKRFFDLLVKPGASIRLLLEHCAEENHLPHFGLISDYLKIFQPETKLKDMRKWYAAADKG